MDAAATGALQNVALQVEVLILGRDARMADGDGGHRGRKPVQARHVGILHGFIA